MGATFFTNNLMKKQLLLHFKAWLDLTKERAQHRAIGYFPEQPQ
jgi:hypothetical protein